MFYGTANGTQHLKLAGQVFYHLTYAPSIQDSFKIKKLLLLL
jgi:hypothetical protein